MFTIYNTLTRKKDQFIPQHNKSVTMYSCGPTVYDYAQIGNWVAYIRWDTLMRTLLANDYKVTRVMNITDVGHLVSDADEGEDKLEKGARREGKTAWEVAEYYTNDFFDGMKKLRLLMPKHITKATDYIPQQISLIQILEEKGYTYKTSDGIYFDASKFSTYANFAKLDLKELREGARVEINDEKHNTYDFALWKFTPKNQKRDMEWDSPWGVGFPGWHLECSAMALDKLGDTIDIHTGGIDHIPVHHTNEIAQSEAATGKKFVNYWLHNNFLLVDGTKASKSLGNAYTLHDIINQGYDAEDFKMFVLQSHYRTASNFTWDNLTAAQHRLRNWRNVANLIWQPTKSTPNNPVISYDTITKAILAALNDDLNTPEALAMIDTFMSSISTGVNEKDSVILKDILIYIEQILGIDLIGKDITKAQKRLLNERKLAREATNWAKSDELRETLLRQGLAVKDTGSTQIWQRV